MNALFSQDARQGRLTTALGQEALVLLRLNGQEELSGDFEWQVEALGSASGLDLEALLGTHATVEIDMAGGTRHFDGVVCEASHGGAAENGWRYDLVLRPWLHVAGLRRTQRIFHNRTVIQIAEEVLADYADLGDPHLEVSTSQDYPVLEYTVQYGESDADFVRRQLERHGISWIWAHEPGSHTMVLVDDVSALPDVPGGARPYRPVDGHHLSEEEHFRTWSGAKRITTGAVRLTEYNFKTPHAAQEVNRSGDAAHTRGDVESFDWPGDYLDQGEGKIVSTRRLKAERGQAPRHRAEGDVAGLAAGARVTVSGDDLPEVTGRRFVCLKAQHMFRSLAYGSGDAADDERAYDGAYVLIPDDAPLMPERRTSAPKIAGPETAVVVGEGEIDCDEHGRILVRFHWDLDSAHSMRCRVSQNWASKGWGGMVIPRIGMEVIVEHLRGDPDKPIVTGCVYNGKNRPPYELPRHKTRSTFRTHTHEGKGFNELRFEDKKDEEEIRIHAERDMNTIIKNDRSSVTSGESVDAVSGNRLVETLGNTLVTSFGGVTLMSGASALTSTAMRGFGNFSNKVSQSAAIMRTALVARFRPGDINIMGDLTVSQSAGEDITAVAARNVSTTSGIDMIQTVGRNLQVNVYKGKRTNVAGDVTDSILGTKIERVKNYSDISVGTKAIIRSGGSRIEIGNDGHILIQSDNITIDAANHLTLKGGRIDIN